MFMRSFSVEQKKAITKLAYAMMMADRSMHVEEQELIRALGHELGVTHMMSPADFHEPADLSVLDGPQVKVAAMLKLFAIAYSDRRMHPAELEVLREYARRLGIGADHFAAMDEWGKRHYTLVAQAKAMVEEMSAAV